MSKDEALKMAIEQMNVYAHIHLCEHQCQDEELLDVIQACKEALEKPSVAELNDEYLRDTHVEGLSQPAQEPVGWYGIGDMYVWKSNLKEDKDATLKVANRPMANNENWKPLYTHPAPSWQGLSDDERKNIIKELEGWDSDADNNDVAVFIEQALKEKNHD